MLHILVFLCIIKWSENNVRLLFNVVADRMKVMLTLLLE